MLWISKVYFQDVTLPLLIMKEVCREQILNSIEKGLIFSKIQILQRFENGPISTKKSLEQNVNLLCWSMSKKDEIPQPKMLMDHVSMADRQTIVWFTINAYAYG